MQNKRSFAGLLALTLLASAVRVEEQTTDTDFHLGQIESDEEGQEVCAQNDPACLIFEDGWNEDDNIGMAYFQGYKSGEDYGLKDCSNDKDYHNYAPVTQCLPGEDPSCAGFPDGKFSEEVLGETFKFSFLVGYQAGWDINCTSDDILATQVAMEEIVEDSEDSSVGLSQIDKMPLVRPGNHRMKGQCVEDYYRSASLFSHDYCPADEGLERWGLACFPRCQPGYHGEWFLCRQTECPKGFKKAGIFCMKPDSYGRGWGYWSKRKCGKNCQRLGLLWIPRCRANFTGVGPLCVPNCPNGMDDWGVSCATKTYNRGLGSKLQCKPEHEDYGMRARGCLEPCKSGWKSYEPCKEGEKGCFELSAWCRPDTAQGEKCTLV